MSVGVYVVLAASLIILLMLAYLFYARRKRSGEKPVKFTPVERPYAQPVKAAPKKLGPNDDLPELTALEQASLHDAVRRILREAGEGKGPE